MSKDVHAVDRTVNLVRLLRRMAALRPAALDQLVRESTKNSSPEVEACLRDYGPFAGLIRLAPLFPHGYLDTSGRVSASGYAHAYRHELGTLLQDLNRAVPQRPGRELVSVVEARLDDIVFREVAETQERVGSPSSENLMERLFAAYDVVPRLPRLDELVQRLKGEVDLGDSVVVAHQHILGSVVGQFEALWSLGLHPSRTFIVGKPYSTNRAAAMYLKHRGCHIRSGLGAYGTGAILLPAVYQTDNNDALGSFFARVLNELPPRDLTRLIVLDDGGLILAWLDQVSENELFTPEQIQRLSGLRVAGVEQTTFGQRLVERLSSTPDVNARPIPIANVAETRLKTEKESRWIGDSVVRELDAWIRSSDARGEHVSSLGEATVGLIGFGVVGSWVARALSDLARRMIVFDEDARKSSIARSIGYQVAHSIPELACECSVLVGCTGAPDGVEIEASMLTPGMILASASSGNYEFARAFITGAKARRPKLNPEINPGRPASGFDWIHSIFPIEVPGGRAFVLNGGFPVNFTGALDPIRPEEIELTRSLIVLGAASALAGLGGSSNFGSEVELVELNESLLNEIFGF